MQAQIFPGFPVAMRTRRCPRYGILVRACNACSPAGDDRQSESGVRQEQATEPAQPTFAARSPTWSVHELPEFVLTGRGGLRLALLRRLLRSLDGRRVPRGRRLRPAGGDRLAGCARWLRRSRLRYRAAAAAGAAVVERFSAAVAQRNRLVGLFQFRGLTANGNRFWH